jgi:FAD:protein FMN transferase
MRKSLSASRRQFIQRSLALSPGLGLGLSARLHARLGAGLIGGVAVGLSLEPSALIARERHLIGFGTQLSLSAVHVDQGLLERALDAAVTRLRHIESVMSLFLPDSQVSVLNRVGQLHHPDSDLLAILRLAQSISRQSAGAFDVTVQPLWALWHQASLESRLPSAQQLQEAKALVDWQNVDLSDELVRFKRAGMGVTLNGIAQGYACDQARMVLKDHGIEHALLDLGEWSALGEARNIGIANPRQDNTLLTTVRLQSPKPGIARSLATSSDAQMSFTPDHRYHHIFNPETGASPALAASVSVLAESCALADALTKVFFMEASKNASFDQWVDRSKALCEVWNVEVVLADKTGQVWSNVQT